jgi:hypothetical protein
MPLASLSQHFRAVARALIALALTFGANLRALLVVGMIAVSVFMIVAVAAIASIACRNRA